MKGFLLVCIRFYQTWISPLKPPSCRFYPSCSEYAAQAIHKHGVFYGTFLAGKRIIKCGPWHKGGHDPVP